MMGASRIITFSGKYGRNVYNFNSCVCHVHVLWNRIIITSLTRKQLMMIDGECGQIFPAFIFPVG